MPYAVLSTCLLNNDSCLSHQEELLHYERLESLIKRLDLHTVFKFQYYRKAPYDGYKMEIPNYKNYATLNNLVTINIFATIQKMLVNEYIDLEEYTPAFLPEEFCMPATDSSVAFRCYLNYLIGKDAVLFIGDKNFQIPRPVQISSDRLTTIKTSTFVEIEISNLLLPYLKNDLDNDCIFPRKEFCANYNTYVKTRIKDEKLSVDEQKALFIDIGNIVATYNGYVKDKRLNKSNKSSDKLRYIYKKEFGRVFYLSIDVESGGFEVFDHKFEHLGQYNFSCELSKSAEPLHHTLK
ncbi:hypothetical protein [Acetobacterium wieringae]|uniref:hypothetical protein n=1 Tax=Acetobacterium wieringae TaxID=52694 RepID=UPI002033231E|nr:hypothetical protein [Acetobacterium wieringae]URN84831.1 hypothetical protein CHL1_000417 [Acetobacterium wieringae]